MRWKTSLKRLVFRLFYYSGAEWLLTRILPVNAAAVIMYHGVCDDSRLPPEVDFHLPRPLFDAHMRMLKRRYRVVPLRRLLDRLQSGEALRKEIVITFDDGYRNNATLAHPILERHALPYTVFVSTAYIGQEAWLPLNELYALWHFGRLTADRTRQLRKQIRSQPAHSAAAILQKLGPDLTPAERAEARDSFGMLSWDEVRSLAGRGVEFGSHTHTHCNMAVETPEQQFQQLRTAWERIHAETGTEPLTFAYPFGRPENWNSQARDNVIAAGHRCAILATGGLVKPQDDLFALPRVGYSRETWYFACELMLLFLKQYFQR